MIEAPASSVGALLQHWRKARNLSQLALATQAEISARHLCFLETGRARPSREMVLLLARTLDVPLRERNELLLAAGFAPLYLESNLDAPALAAVAVALGAILRQQEPFPAVVMNRHWDVLRTNDAGARFFAFLLQGRWRPDPPNVLRMMLHPEAVRPFVANWDAVADALVRRVHRESIGGIQDEGTKKLLDEITRYPGVLDAWRRSRADGPLSPTVPVSFVRDGKAFDFFSTVTTLGTPQDVALQEIRIECFFPANDDTRRAASKMLEKRF